VLATDAPDSQQELARLMAKPPPVMVAVVDGLEEKGLFARRRSPEDRRRSVVEPTAAGLDVLARADAVAERVIVDLFSTLDDDERAAFHATLRRAMAGEALPA
jgi:MarR family transcriptional regulator, lower aerobic nicotinate degradation pathway regulator